MAAKSASDYGTYRKRKLEEFVDQNLIVLSLEHVTKDKEGKELQFGPFFVARLCINATGELAEAFVGQKYVYNFFMDVFEAGAYPVNFRLIKPKKAYEITDWEESEE